MDEFTREQCRRAMIDLLLANAMATEGDPVTVRNKIKNNKIDYSATTWWISTENCIYIEVVMYNGGNNYQMIFIDSIADLLNSLTEKGK